MLSHCWRPSLAALTALALAAPHAPAGLAEYVKKPEPKFAWKLVRTTDTPAGKVYNLHLVSQTWQGITWEHDLVVYVPKEVKPGKTLFLLNTGGKPNVVSTALMMELGGKMGLPCAFPHGTAQRTRIPVSPG
jgi:PhoPQ-activated pathogenicity-related protein